MDFRKSADVIQNDMLNEIDNSYEKSKGYFLWDILKAFAIKIKDVLYQLQDVADRLDVENLSGNFLERFIYQRTGIKRKEATYAEGILTVNGNGVVGGGDLFETEGLSRYKAVETVKIINEGAVKIKAVSAGTEGNVPSGAVTRIPVTIPGITGCYNENEISGGYDAENDEDLLGRYYERIQMPATSGNVYHYRRWALEVAGVGDAKIFPLWNGNNTVKTVIIDQYRLPASEELVKEVQEYIDPGITGTGEGQAPIGAFCTVAAAEPMEINVALDLILLPGYKIHDIKYTIEQELKNYLAGIAFKKSYLSYAVVGARILNVDGVQDYKNLTLNGAAQNIECGEYEVMILGSVTLNEQQ